MGVTEVIRGDDLLPATPAQILLARALKNSGVRAFGHSVIASYCHVPLVVGKDGKRLAKRHGDTRIATYREAGKAPEELIGFLAASCGWAAKGERVTLADLVPRFDLGTIPHSPFMV
jgi:glutamyl-tRNA synthetase